MDYRKILLSILVNGRGIDIRKMDKIENHCPCIRQYLLSYYEDSLSAYETIRRMKDCIEVKPKCPTCGGPVNYIGKTKHMFSKYCSNSCRAKDPVNYMKWVNGQHKYNMEHYGVESIWQRDDVKQKRKQAMLDRYGTTATLKIDSAREKAKQTSLKHYGVPYPCQSDEIKEKNKASTLKHYGVEYPMQTQAIKDKRIKTQAKNHTFNTSSQEELCFVLLSLIHPDITRQYKDDRYPYACDFYIPSIDTFIEYNGSWTHGKHFFDETNENDVLIKSEWEAKSVEHKYYKSALYTWTELDVRKYKCALKNNINYIVLWNINDVYNHILHIPLNEALLRHEFEFFSKAKGVLSNVTKSTNIITYFQQDLFYKEEKELFRNADKRAKYIENRKQYLHKDVFTAEELLKGYKHSGIYYGYSHFNPLLFKWFINEYGVKSCYDPCGGWGHRLLGGLSLDSYIYNDLSSTAAENVRHMIDYFNISNTIVYSNDATCFMPVESFDAIFTCPPYYNTEIYECGAFADMSEYDALIDGIFNAYEMKKDCKVLGLVLREDMLHGHTDYVDRYDITVNNSAHLNNGKHYKEYLYIFKKIF